MKLTTKIIALILAVILSLGVFVGCNKNTGDASTNGDATTADPNADQGTPTVSEKIEINSENISEYKLVTAAEKSDLLNTAINDFNSGVSDIIGKGFTVTSDADAAGEKEIVVGKTSREFSQAFTEDLRKEEYGIIADGESVYIVGVNDLYVDEALDYFLETYLDTDAKEISLDKDLIYYESPYLLKRVSIDGVNIRNYKIIIPSDADLLTQYAAEHFANYFSLNGVGTVTVSKDTVAESEYEILIGDTNRAASNVSVETKSGEYILYKSGSKIVCKGNDIWVGGGAGAIIGRLPTEGRGAVVNITDIPTEPVATKFEFKEAKNAIIMIGDGMGFNTVDMYKADKNAVFYAEYMTNKGNAYTGSYTTQQNSSTPTDSAAGGTALSSGYKTVNGYLGVTPQKNAMPNIREIAHMTGAKTAVLTTDAITGATPSAFLIHHDNRNDTSVIQSRIDELVSNKGVDMAMGSITALKKSADLAIRKISVNGSNFFMMIEEGHIDKRSHSKDRAGCVDMVERFNETIAYVIEFVICHPDTVLIITADHETGDIQKTANGDFVYTSLPDNPSKANHSTQNVPVYALGYGTEYFNDKEVDNTEIPKFVSKIFGAVNFGV